MSDEGARECPHILQEECLLSRRAFTQKVMYVTPLILTLPMTLSFASSGSEAPSKEARGKTTPGRPPGC